MKTVIEGVNLGAGIKRCRKRMTSNARSTATIILCENGHAVV